MRNYTIVFLLIHTIKVFCPERNLLPIRNNRGLAKADDSSPLSKSRLKTYSIKSEALKDGCESCESNAGIHCDGRVHVKAQMMSNFAAKATAPRNYNIELGHLEALKSPHKTDNEQKQRATPPNSKLSVDAAPFVPQPHSRLSPYHAPKQLLMGVPNDPPTTSGTPGGALQQKAPCRSLSFLRFIHHRGNIPLGGTGQYSNKKSWLTNLKLPTQVIAGFSRAQELQDWFRNVGLSTQREEEIQFSKNVRRRFVRRIAKFEDAYRQLKILSAFGMDEVPGKKKETEFAILNAYDFGHLVLKAFNSPMCMLESLFKMLNFKIKQVKVFNDSQFEKFFFWPVILAGAREWYLREASIFSIFFRCCRPKESEMDLTGFPEDDFEELNSITPENITKNKLQETNGLAKILGEEGINGEEQAWLGFSEDMIAKEDYYSLNTRIEAVIFHHFQDEAKNYDGQRLYISQEKLEGLCSKWGMAHYRLVALVRHTINSRRSRGIYTMSHELSKASLKFFENSLVELSKETLKKNIPTDQKLSDHMNFEFLNEIYEGVNRYHKF